MHRSYATPFVALLAVALSAGCGQGQSQAHGNASYAKPQSQGGQPVAPQQNQSDMQVTVAIDGSGAFAPVQDAACALTSGSLSESSQTQGTVNGDGTYVSGFSSESANGSGTAQLCGALKNVKLQSITSMTVQATIPANDTNCQGYCKATADSQCQGSIDPNCSANAQASCTTQCKSSQKITGHGSLQSSDMAATNSALGSGSGTVDAKVDLIFDALQ